MKRKQVCFRINKNLLANEIKKSFERNHRFVNVKTITQKSVKNILKNNHNFMMLSNETTSCNKVVANVGCSKFLNDKNYSKEWIVVYCGTPVAFLYVKEQEKTLVISALEVNNNYKGMGIGKNIVNGVECYSKHNGFENIKLMSFDKFAKNFWNHIGYKGNDKCLSKCFYK